MKKIALIAALLCAVACGKEGENQADIVDMEVYPPIEGMETPSESFVAPMMLVSYQKTDNPDEGFLVTMIPHHQSAVLSSEEYLKVGKDKDALTFAQNIISAQKKEIAEFKAYMDNLDEEAINYSDAESKKVADESEKMMNSMLMTMSSMRMTGDADIDYLASMIPHHQGSIDLSKSILSITKNEKIKEIANQIIADQEKEITNIKKMLAKL